MQDGYEPSFSFTGHNDQVHSIAFSPNGQLFASGSVDGVLMIWDASTGDKLFDSLTGHSECVNSIAFSPDGTQVASGSSDETIRLWSSITGAPIGNPFEGHTSQVRSVAFSPTGSQLVSGSEDRTGTDHVLSVAFSPDGTLIVSGSADTAIRLWNAPPQGTSSDLVRYEELPREDVNNAGGDPSLDWQMDDDGWIRDSKHQLLLWVPPDLRSILLRRRNLGLISRRGCIQLDFSGARIGDEWETCYKPFPLADH
ncbi:WD40-repeat protein (notchless protein), related protein, partial [Rhizoctonia solani AG-3 Rhs1AP]